MSMDYIRKTYGVPAKRGSAVLYSPPNEKPRRGRILGADGTYLRVQLEARPGMVQKPTVHHPTWHLEYLEP
jgi:hypothetical protein